MFETVTLKRARRVRPHRTKKARQRWSRGVRKPMAKATAAGATPKDICCQGISTTVEPQLKGAGVVPSRRASPALAPSYCSSCASALPFHQRSRKIGQRAGKQVRYRGQRAPWGRRRSTGGRRKRRGHRRDLWTVNKRTQRGGTRRESNYH